MSTTARADLLFSKLVRSRGACEYCGSTQDLECAHVIGRTYYPTRWDPRNAKCLCRDHHRFFTAHPAKWREWIGRSEWFRLHKKAHSLTKVDIADVIRDLHAALKAVA